MGGGWKNSCIVVYVRVNACDVKCRWEIWRVKPCIGVTTIRILLKNEWIRCYQTVAFLVLRVRTHSEPSGTSLICSNIPPRILTFIIMLYIGLLWKTKSELETTVKYRRSVEGCLSWEPHTRVYIWACRGFVKLIKHHENDFVVVCLLWCEIAELAQTSSLLRWLVIFLLSFRKISHWLSLFPSS